MVRAWELWVGCQSNWGWNKERLLGMLAGQLAECCHTLDMWVTRPEGEVPQGVMSGTRGSVQPRSIAEPVQARRCCCSNQQGVAVV